MSDARECLSELLQQGKAKRDDSKQTNNTNFTIMNILCAVFFLFASAIRHTMFVFEICSPYDECHRLRQQSSECEAGQRVVASVVDR